MGFKGEGKQAKDTDNVFNKVIAENLPDLEKEMLM
jgi:hypothetical protein